VTQVQDLALGLVKPHTVKHNKHIFYSEGGQTLEMITEKDSGESERRFF